MPATHDVSTYFALGEAPAGAPAAHGLLRPWLKFQALQADISTQRLARKVGQTQTVLVETLTEGGALARSYADAPEIDGLVYVQGKRGLKAGEFLTVKITGSDAHDLRAKPLRSL